MSAWALRSFACAVALLAFAGKARTDDDRDWPNYRHDTSRSARQGEASKLSDPAKVPGLAVRWQFPPGPQPPLLGTCTAGGGFQTFGAYGVMSSASGYRRLVIFGAPDPDPTVDAGLGSGRLFALDQETGALKWKSDVLARVNGCTPGATFEQHERIGYSSPLVNERRVYVGIHDAGD